MQLHTPVLEPGSARGEQGDEAETAAGAELTSTDQSGATLFSELVWVHHRWHRAQKTGKAPDPALERAYQEKLSRFQTQEGAIEHVYWSTRNASAVAMTVKEGKPRFANRMRLRDRDDIIRLHRLTDWVTRDNAAIANLLHDCDVLAIRVGEILRGTSERIAMRWILGIEAHLLGFFERRPLARSGGHDAEAEAELVETQRAKLAEIEAYYYRAAIKAGRIVYVSGMLMGICIVALLGALAGVLLRIAGVGAGELEVLMLCFGAGAVGALVSALSRMGRSAQGGFSIDFEIGRPLMRRLGVYRPFVGAVFGVVLYLLLESELLDITPTAGKELYYYGFAAFLAGFSERFATVLFGAAEERLGGRSGEPASGEASGEVRAR